MLECSGLSAVMAKGGRGFLWAVGLSEGVKDYVREYGLWMWNKTVFKIINLLYKIRTAQIHQDTVHAVTVITEEKPHLDKMINSSNKI
jgi:hypothetical protein